MVNNRNVLGETLSSFLVELPTPVSISYLWNFGSMLAFCLGVQIITGIFLAMHYNAHVDLAFLSVIHISRDVVSGWLIRFIHINGASLFFFCLYLHIGRGLFYSSYVYREVWMAGVIIFFLSMMTAFMGYVLPWGQMSFWGASVITSLVSAVPYCGQYLVEWLWGGYSVGCPTLVRFFALHFLCPFLIVVFVMIHLLFLHETGSSMPLGVKSDILMIEFYVYYALSDLLGLLFLFFGLMMVVFFSPNMFGDCDNFVFANQLVTPEHIQPEWYFLFAYAILRSIPNKFGGVVALLSSILVLAVCGFYSGSVKFGGWMITWKILFWALVVVFLILTWIGARPVEVPFLFIGQMFTTGYFFLFFSLYLVY